MLCIKLKSKVHTINIVIFIKTHVKVKMVNIEKLLNLYNKMHQIIVLIDKYFQVIFLRIIQMIHYIREKNLLK